MRLSGQIRTLSLAFLLAAQSACVTERPEMPEKTLPLIMDVDTGRDDAWAIFGAMKDCRLEGVVATYGNVPLDHTIQNSLDVVAAGEKDLPHACHDAVPVWRGEAQPLAGAPPSSLAEIARRAKTNGNGICNLVLPQSTQAAANGSGDWGQDMAKYIRAHGKAEYVAIGPMTNLARLIDAFGNDAQGKPDILNYIPKVVVMGGSFDPALAVDFNFHADPAAAEKIIKVFGERLTLVPYDETRKLRLTEAEINALQPQDKAAEFSKALMVAQARGWSADHSVLLHDPATLLAMEPGARLTHEKIKIVLSGQDAGKVVEDAQGTPVYRLTIPAGAENATRNHLLNRYLDLK